MTIEQVLVLTPLFGFFVGLGGLYMSVTGIKENVSKNEAKIRMLNDKIDTIELLSADIREIKTNIKWLIEGQKDKFKSLEKQIEENRKMASKLQKK